MTLPNSLSEFIDLDSSTAVRVDLVELFAERKELLRVHHLDEDVKTLSPQSIFAMEVLQTLHDIIVKDAFMGIIFPELMFEPDVVLAFRSGWSGFRIRIEHLGE